MDVGTIEFFRFAKLAWHYELEYLVVGGLALNFHEIARNTIDSDVWLNPKKDNYLKLDRVLIDLGYDSDEMESV